MQTPFRVPKADVAFYLKAVRTRADMSILLIGIGREAVAPGTTIRGIAAPLIATTIRPTTATTTTVFA